MVPNPSANPFDTLESLQTIQKFGKSADPVNLVPQNVADFTLGGI